MLNQCHVEGFITKKQWKYDGDTFFRLAIYRDPDRTRKEADREAANEKDQPDYVTICVPAALTAMPVEFTAGRRIQAHGWLESREYAYSLQEFLEKAQGPKLDINTEKAEQVSTHRGTTWIVAERIVTIENGR